MSRISRSWPSERPHTHSDTGLCSGQLIVSRPGRPAGLGLSGLDRGPWQAETLPPSPRHSHFLSGAPEIQAGFKARGCSQPEHGVTSEVTGRTSRSMLAGNLHVSGCWLSHDSEQGGNSLVFSLRFTPREPESSRNEHSPNIHTHTRITNACICRAWWEHFQKAVIYNSHKAEKETFCCLHIPILIKRIFFG